MHNFEEQVKKRTLLEQSSNNIGEARRSFNEVQFEVNKERIISAEKAGWWSGAAILLSFTLIGYFMANETLRPYLQKDIIDIPIIYFLFIGWISFLFSITGSVLCRLFNSSYLVYNKANYWASTEKEFCSLQLNWIIAGYDFLPLDTESKDLAKENIEESKKNYSDLEISSRKKQSIFLRSANLSVAATFAGALIGFISFGIFLISITFQIVLL